jgi:hypothetical protein
MSSLSRHSRSSRAFVAVATTVVVLVVMSAVVAAARGAATGVDGWLGPWASASTGPAPTGPGPTDAPRAENADRLRLAAPDRPIRIRNSSLFGWALLDRVTGQMAGSPNSGRVTNTVESMIKPWIAADHLRRLAADGRRPPSDSLNELFKMIVDSNDPATEKYFQIGGGDAVTRRMARTCGLSRVMIVPTRWSETEMTPQDAARYGHCLADGRAAGPEWTAWLLDAMTKVRGDVGDGTSGAVQGGRWGIIDGLPAQHAGSVSIKNGWTSYVDGWHVNCLAVHPDWSLAVMLRMPSLRSAAQACEDVAQALVVGDGE